MDKGLTTDTPTSNRPLDQDERTAAKLEVEAIRAAEQDGDFKNALALLTQAIESCPKYPSPYNNRAQVLCLMDAGNREMALKDLDKAISLGHDFPAVQRQAYCQRAWIRRVEGNMDEAFADYEAAAKLGSNVGRKMAVACNPYARLCNNIMQEMLEKVYFTRPADP